MIPIFELADKDFTVSIINMLKKIEAKNVTYEKIKNFNRELGSIKKESNRHSRTDKCNIQN